MENSKTVESRLILDNRKYVENHQKCESEEAKKHAIFLTCMDARIDPLKFGNLHDGDVYVLRNGGGRATDNMIRSAVLIIRLFAADTIFVIHHTDCGLEKIDDLTVRKLLHKSLGPAKLGDYNPPSKHNTDKYRNADYVAFLAFDDLEESVVNDVARLRQSPLISEKVTIFGYVYDVHTGELHKVKKACEIGECK